MFGGFKRVKEYFDIEDNPQEYSGDGQRLDAEAPVTIIFEKSPKSV